MTTLTDRFAEVMRSSSVRDIEFHFCSMPVTTELQFLELKFTTNDFHFLLDFNLPMLPVVSFVSAIDANLRELHTR